MGGDMWEQLHRMSMLRGERSGMAIAGDKLNNRQMGEKSL